MIKYKQTFNLAVLDRQNNKYFTVSNKSVLSEILGDRSVSAIKKWFNSDTGEKTKTRRYKHYEIIDLDGHYSRKSNQPGRHISDLRKE